jgi:hypothetical protein
VRESSPGVTGLRADAIILLADEDCSKDLVLDTYGADPTLVSSLAASSNLYDNVSAANITTKTATYGPHINASCATFLPLGFTVFGSFSKELRALFDRFTRTIFEREQDSFCRSLSSIRKYYLKNMCMSMSAACVTKARMHSSRSSYSFHDVNCNCMQDAS